MPISFAKWSQQRNTAKGKVKNALTAVEYALEKGHLIGNERHELTRIRGNLLFVFGKWDDGTIISRFNYSLKKEEEK